MTGGLPVHADGLRWARQAAARIDSSRPQMFLSSCIAELLAVMHAIPRTTAFLEVFSGAGMTAKNVDGAGFVANTFEKLDADYQDGCSAVAGVFKCSTPPAHRQVMRM